MTIEAMKAIQMVYANTTKHDWPDDIWDAICQAIEAEKHEVSQEPVAWMDKSGITHKHKHFEDMTPLYTHPQPKREPLTDEQITKAFNEAMALRPKEASNAETNRLFVRCIEAAHGIKEKNT